MIHIIAQRLEDLSRLLASVGNRADVADIYRVSRADVVKSPVTPDPRDPAQRLLGKAPRDIYIPLCREQPNGINAEEETMPIPFGKPRNFR